jgi:hypothetical protein
LAKQIRNSARCQLHFSLPNLEKNTDDYRKQRVLVHLDAEQQVFCVSCDNEVVKRLEIRGLLPETMDFQSYLVALKQEARTIERHRLTTRYKSGEVA